MGNRCPKCQFDNPPDTLYCGKCATPLPSPEEISVSHTKTLETPIEELTTGSTFAGRYQIIEELGKGGMGKVYKALDKEVNEKIALKLIKPEIAADKKTIERFRNELRFARKIRHKNVCQMYDLNREEGTYYITMEYVSGEDLKSFIRRSGQLAVGTTIRISKQVCEGLAEAHRIGVIHRDLKPSNIMIDKEGNARIMDFGIARSLRAKGITGAGVMIGTPEYMSPEQVEAKETDQRSDIYSLGVILYEMVTGRVPFEGDTPLSVAVQHRSDIPKDPMKLNAQIPEDLSRMILRCLEKDRANRYQSAGEVRSELSNIEKGIHTKELVVPEQKPSSSREKTIALRKRWVMIVAFFVVVVIVGASILYLRNKRPVLPLEKKMLVVLPFENLGLPEDEYFADGITDEITGRLASLQGLGVISRTSAIKYKKIHKTIKQIGEELGVDYVLEGTVRWDRTTEGKGLVRVTPQLIRVSDDTHIWSERYDREIEYIFTVQSKIAEQVIRQLNIALLDPERRALEARPTDNMEAYQAYLRGLDYRKLETYSEENMRLVVQMFERAVDLDPTFALAHGALSRAHSSLINLGMDRTQERLAKAKAAVDRALELQPELPEAHLSLGYYYYWGLRDYDLALEELYMAGRRLPNENDILNTSAWILRRQGRWDESLEHAKQALELSPRDASLIRELGNINLALGNYKQAEDYYNRCIALAPDDRPAYVLKAINYWCGPGDTEKARASLEAMPERVDSFSIFFWFYQELFERNYQVALDRLASAPVEIFVMPDTFMPKALLEGFVYQLEGKPERSRCAYESALALLEEEVKERPGDARVHSSLGLVYAALGHREKAIKEGKLGVELYPVSKDALHGPRQVEILAQIYMLVGDQDTALEKLEYLLSIPSSISVSMLRIDPKWDPLREHPRFQQLLKEKS